MGVTQMTLEGIRIYKLGKSEPGTSLCDEIVTHVTENADTTTSTRYK